MSYSTLYKYRPVIIIVVVSGIAEDYALTYQETEAATVLVVGTVFNRSGGCPQRLAPISISLELLEQLEVLQEPDPVSNNHHLHLFQVVLLQDKSIRIQQLKG